MKILCFTLSIFILVSCGTESQNTSAQNNTKTQDTSITPKSYSQDTITNTSFQNETQNSSSTPEDYLQNNATKADGISEFIDLNALKTYSFDYPLYKCEAKLKTNGGGTGDMINCYNEAATELDSVMNKIYNELYKKLDNEDKKRLKLSQDNWLKYYEAEKEYLYKVYFTWANESKYGHGREHSITQAQWKYEILRQRVVSLTRFNEEVFIIDDK